MRAAIREISQDMLEAVFARLVQVARHKQAKTARIRVQNHLCLIAFSFKKSVYETRTDSVGVPKKRLPISTRKN